MHAAWLLIGALAGCSKPHPLLADQLALQALAEGSAPDTPHASIHLGAPLLDRIEQHAAQRLVREIPKTLPLDLPLIGRTNVKPGLKRPSLSLADARCQGCVAVQGAWAGNLTVGQQGPLPWTAKTHTTLAFTTLNTVDGGQEVQLGVSASGEQAVDVNIDGLKPMLARVASGLLEVELQRQLREGPLATPRTLVELSPTQPHLHGAQLTAGDTLTASPSFVVLHHGAPAQPPEPGDGFVVVLPTQTLLGLLHAAVAYEAPVRGYSPEPVSLAITPDGRWTLGIALWKAKRRGAKARDYTLSGSLSLDDEALAFQVDEVTAAEGWRGNPASMLIDRQLAGYLDGDTTFAVPTTHDIAVGSESWTLSATRLSIEADRILLFGDVALPTPARRQPARR